MTAAVTHRLQILHRELQLYRAVPRMGWRLHLRNSAICRYPSEPNRTGAEEQPSLSSKVSEGKQRTRWVLQLSIQSTCGQRAQA